MLGLTLRIWKTRWFVLKDNRLFYARNPKSPLDGVVNLVGCKVAKLEGKRTTQRFFNFKGLFSRSFSFSVKTASSMSADANYSNRTYYFSAVNSEEMEEWIEFLTIAGRPYESTHRTKGLNKRFLKINKKKCMNQKVRKV